MVEEVAVAEMTGRRRDVTPRFLKAEFSTLIGQGPRRLYSDWLDLDDRK